MNIALLFKIFSHLVNETKMGLLMVKLLKSVFFNKRTQHNVRYRNPSKNSVCKFFLGRIFNKNLGGKTNNRKIIIFDFKLEGPSVLCSVGSSVSPICLEYLVLIKAIKLYTVLKFYASPEIKSLEPVNFATPVVCVHSTLSF